MDNPNTFSRVKISSNPVKSIVLHHIFTNEDTTVRCKLDPHFLNLREGVWQFAVAHVIILNNSDALETVVDLKTNLSYTCQIIDHNPVTVNECLASIEVRCKKDNFVFFAPKTQTFFTVNDSSNDYFTLCLSINKLLVDQNPRYKLTTEVRLFFQRMI